MTINITSETIGNVLEWDFHYDVKNDGTPMRSNLVYTPRVNSDRTIFCMDFNRDFNFHNKPEENKLWTDDMLLERFNRELKFHDMAKSCGIPVLEILEVDYSNRRIFTEWYDTDFFMLGYKNQGFDNVLPDWREQWLNIMETLWKNNILKISLHPNSFAVKNGKLVAFNWFFTFENNEMDTSLLNYLPQISTERFEKLEPILKKFNITKSGPLKLRTMQELALNVFVSNYPKELMDEAISVFKFIEKNQTE